MSQNREDSVKGNGVMSLEDKKPGRNSDAQARAPNQHRKCIGSLLRSGKQCALRTTIYFDSWGGLLGGSGMSLRISSSDGGIDDQDAVLLAAASESVDGRGVCKALS